ncbi:MAG: hypothetical protein ACKVK4_00125 [Flavobacteriales bacterium]|jgi:hypothetical protein|tara:strand:- start:133 stop:1107 length:975 start_codon:yes stop_codon:yes gene_type:complete
MSYIKKSKEWKCSLFGKYFLGLCVLLFFMGCFSKGQVDDKPEVVVLPIEQDFVTKIGPIYSYAPESSGIVLSDGYVFTINDSGSSSVIYKVNPSDGSLVQSISVNNYDNMDWEDITYDSDYIYIGDFGNNRGKRTDLKVLKISKSQFINKTALTVSVTAEVIEFSYSEQTSFIPSSTHNFDCESFISKGDNLYLFTKNRGDNKTRAYKLSKEPGQYSLTTLASYEVNGLVTGADYNTQTNELVLIGYSASMHTNSFVYMFFNFTDDLFFSADVAKKVIGNATNDWQTEAIAFGSADGENLFISCESTDFSTATLYKTDKTTLGF